MSKEKWNTDEVIGAIPQRVNFFDPIQDCVLVTVPCAFLIYWAAQWSDLAGWMVGVVVVAPLAWWLWTRAAIMRWRLHLDDASVLRVDRPAGEDLVVARCDVAGARVVEVRSWRDYGYVPRPTRAVVILELVDGGCLELKRFWRQVDRRYEDPPWKIAEILSWSGMGTPQSIIGRPEHR